MAATQQILDPTVKVGQGWSSDKLRGSYEGLAVKVTVKSKSETISTPAGTFEDCIHIEQVVTEKRLPEHLPEERKVRIRNYFCGVREAGYAPGVGLVQFSAHTLGGTEALVQLADFTVNDSNDYIPLQIGNSWTYIWANIPAEYTAREIYRVAAADDDKWYLEVYSYALRGKC